MTETWPLRYGLEARVELGETDRVDGEVPPVKQEPDRKAKTPRERHEPGCMCDRCKRVYNSAAGRPPPSYYDVPKNKS